MSLRDQVDLLVCGHSAIELLSCLGCEGKGRFRRPELRRPESDLGDLRPSGQGCQRENIADKLAGDLNLKVADQLVEAEPRGEGRLACTYCASEMPSHCRPPEARDCSAARSEPPCRASADA
jgi:hypothetical protein